MLKSTFYTIIELIVILSLFNINVIASEYTNNQNLLVIEDRYINLDSEFIKIDFKYPLVKMPYNTAIEKIINNLIEEYMSTLQKGAKDIEKSAITSQSKNEKKYYCHTDYTVTYNKNDLLSITIAYTDHTGGSHDMYVNKSFNFDLNTGKNLYLADLFKGEKKDYMLELITRNVSNGLKNINGISSEFAELKNDTKFFLADTYLKVYFDIYEYTDYKKGIPYFKMPYSMFNDNLKYNLLENSNFRYNDSDIVNILNETSEFQNGEIAYIGDRLGININNSECEIEMLYTAVNYIYNNFNSSYITNDEIETFIYHTFGKKINAKDVFFNHNSLDFRPLNLRYVNNVYYFSAPVDNNALITTKLKDQNNFDGTSTIYGIITDNSMLQDVFASAADDKESKKLYGYKLNYRLNRDSALGYNVMSYIWKEIDYKNMILEEIEKE